MTKKQLIEKVAKLEKRIAELEKRPAVVINNTPAPTVIQPITIEPWVQPYVPNPWGTPVITCDLGGSAICAAGSRFN